jgi:carboxyl-terminal processing protease
VTTIVQRASVAPWSLPVIAIPSLLALYAAPVGAQAAGSLTAQAARDSLDHMRDRAESLWKTGDSRGLALLDSAAAFLAQEHVSDLLRGSLDLQTRAFNFAFERACARAIAGDAEGALRAMKGMYEAGAPPRFEDIIERACPRLYELRGETAYRHVLGLWRSERLRWSGATLATPYRDTLSVDERIAGLSVLWSNVKHVLPGFETRPGLDLDSLYLAYLPRVRPAQSTLQYYLVLMRFVAALRDAHSNVYLPDTLASRRYARPPLRTLPVEGTAVVRWVLAPELDSLGIAPGQVVLSIDGVRTDEYVRTRVAPYVSASTPQDRALRAYGYELLAGDAAEPVDLILRQPDGTTFQVEVPRSGYDTVRPLKANRDTVLDGNIGYLRLDDFAARGVADYVVEAMTRLVETNGLIIDVRRNGGGSGWPGYRLLTTLIDTTFVGNPSWVRMPNPIARSYGIEPRAVPLGSSTFVPDDSLHYRQPVVVLTSAMTFSAAEDFVAAFVGLGRALVIGMPTGGSTGQPFQFRLPGGGSARVRAKHDTFVDGREFIGRGIQPDVLVEPTIADIAAGHDPVLEAARRALRSRHEKDDR